jgi:RNA polymerase sigma-70 factor (ECF subfamily)
LTLQAVCGLNAREIAQAFLLPEPAVAQRLVRAKRALAGERFELPAQLEHRLGAVLAVLYLLFNEGHAAVRIDLCEEALALARELATDPRTARPPVHALLALMLFQASRLDAREPLLSLEQQDRTRWNRQRIGEAFTWFERSLAGPALTRYHLEAAIAAEHARAPSFRATDWAMIAAQYDRLVALEPSPAARLNRAIALGLRDGAAAGLAELRALAGLDGHHRYWASIAYFSEGAEAAAAWSRARALAMNPRDREFLELRLAMIEGKTS